jgi:hypothetical protein
MNIEMDYRHLQADGFDYIDDSSQDFWSLLKILSGTVEHATLGSCDKDTRFHHSDFKKMIRLFLPKLESLKICGLELHNDDTYSRTESHNFNYPLKDLLLHISDYQIFEEFYGCTRLKSLKLCGTKSNDELLVKFLQQLPDLKWLLLNSQMIQYCSVAWSQMTFQLNTLEVFLKQPLGDVASCNLTKFLESQTILQRLAITECMSEPFMTALCRLPLVRQIVVKDGSSLNIDWDFPEGISSETIKTLSVENSEYLMKLTKMFSAVEKIVFLGELFHYHEECFAHMNKLEFANKIEFNYAPTVVDNMEASEQNTLKFIEHHSESIEQFSFNLRVSSNPSVGFCEAVIAILPDIPKGIRFGCMWIDLESYICDRAGFLRSDLNFSDRSISVDSI